MILQPVSRRLYSAEMLSNISVSRNAIAAIVNIPSVCGDDAIIPEARSIALRTVLSALSAAHPIDWPMKGASLTHLGEHATWNEDHSLAVM